MIKRVYIEITNRCNLRCSFCAFHHREFKEMTLQEFEHVMQQVKPITNYIYLHVQGEPLLHSQFDQILTLCDQYEMNVQLVTNGTLLKGIHWHHPSIRKCSISIHSIDEQVTSEKDYMESIFSFIEYHKNSFYIDCRFWMKENLKPKSKYCLDQFLNKYNVILTNKQNYTLEKNVFLGFGSQFEWPIEAHSEKTMGTCKGAKNMLAVLSNGQVTICCLDSEGKINLGNIFDTDLAKIINSTNYLDILNGFSNNKCIEGLCKQCTYKDRFR